MSKKQQCPIEALGLKHIDYKNTDLLKQYITKFNKITPRYYSGVSLKNQKKLAQAIKRARYMALLPYVLDLRTRVSAPTAPAITVAVETVSIEEGTTAAI